MALYRHYESRGKCDGAKVKEATVFRSLDDVLGAIRTSKLPPEVWLEAIFREYTSVRLGEAVAHRRDLVLGFMSVLNKVGPI